MNNKITKYEANFFERIFNKIKLFFFKKNIEENEIKDEEIKDEEIKELKNEETKEVKIINDEAKQKFVELVKKFEAKEIEEEDLMPEEVEQLTRYYENKDKELDEKIEKHKRVLETINIKLNRYYEKTISLKENKE